MNVFENFIKTVNYWVIELKSVFYLLKVAQLIMLLEPQATFTIALFKSNISLKTALYVIRECSA